MGAPIFASPTGALSFLPKTGARMFRQGGEAIYAEMVRVF